MIKRHPGDGAALLAHIGGFASELPLVRGHHERLDGSGYPDGLRGDELSLEVRILGVCDVYDALTSERVYRRACRRRRRSRSSTGPRQRVRPRRARRALARRRRGAGRATPARRQSGLSLELAGRRGARQQRRERLGDRRPAR